MSFDPQQIMDAAAHDLYVAARRYMPGFSVDEDGVYRLVGGATVDDIDRYVAEAETIVAFHCPDWGQVECVLSFELFDGSSITRTFRASGQEFARLERIGMTEQIDDGPSAGF